MDTSRSHTPVLAMRISLILVILVGLMPMTTGCTTPCGEEATSMVDDLNRAYLNFIDDDDYGVITDFEFMPFDTSSPDVIVPLTDDEHFLQELGYFDGHLAVGSQGPAQEYLVENGTLAGAWSVNDSVRDSSFKVIYGDIDDDGDQDMVVGNLGQRTKVYLRENGILMDEPAWISSRLASTLSIALGDVTGDGLLDLIEGIGYESSSGEVLIYWNMEGNLTTAPFHSIPFDHSVTGVALADIQGDGVLDLAVSTYGGRDAVFKGVVSEGSFRFDDPKLLVGVNTSTHEPVWVDLAGDGYPDIMFVRDGEPDVIYSNEFGHFSGEPTWTSAGANESHAATWGDVDGNGHVDLVVSGKEGIWVHLNFGKHLQTNSIQFIEADAIHGICLIDMDSDGDLDLVSTSALGTNLTIYENVFQEDGAVDDFVDKYGKGDDDAGFLPFTTGPGVMVVLVGLALMMSLNIRQDRRRP